MEKCKLKKIIAVVYILFAASCFTFVSCKNFLAGSNLKEKIEDEITWANIKNPLKIDYMSPVFQGAGVPCDSIIELSFNKSIIPSTFEFSLTDEAGSDLKNFYEEPVFYEDNKLVKIFPSRENPLEIAAGDIRNIVLTLSKDISDTDKVKLGREDISYNIRLNSKTDDLPPVLRNVKIIKKVLDSDEEEMTTDSFENWEEKDFHLNHVNSFYIDLEARDSGVGAAYIKVKEELLYTPDGKSVHNFAEKLTEINFNKNKDDSSLYSTKSLYQFETADDGLIKVEISVLDFNKNESHETFCFYVIKDTTFAGEIDAFYNLGVWAYTTEKIDLNTFFKLGGYDELVDYKWIFASPNTYVSSEYFETDFWFSYKGTDYQHSFEELNFKIEKGKSLEDLSQLKKGEYSISDNDIGFSLEEYIEDQYLSLTVWDEAGNFDKKTFHIPGKPELLYIHSLGSDYYNFVTDKRVDVSGILNQSSYNFYYAEKGSEDYRNNIFNCLSSDMDSRVFLPNIDNYVFRIQEVWGLGEHFFFHSPLSDEYDGAIYKDFDVLNTPLDFDLSLKNLEGGNRLYTLTLNTEGLTEKQISQCYAVYEYTKDSRVQVNTNNSFPFVKKDNKYIAEIILPSKFETGYTYWFAAGPFGVDENKVFTNAKCIETSEIVDNVPPKLTNPSNSSYYEPEVDYISNCLKVKLTDEGSGLAGKNEDTVSLEVYYKKNGTVLDNLLDCSKLELELTKTDDDVYVIPFYYFDSGVYNLRFRLFDKTGNVKLTENFYFDLRAPDYVNIGGPEFETDANGTQFYITSLDPFYSGGINSTPFEYYEENDWIPVPINDKTGKWLNTTNNSFLRNTYPYPCYYMNFVGLTDDLFYNYDCRDFFYEWDSKIGRYVKTGKFLRFRLKFTRLDSTKYSAPYYRYADPENLAGKNVNIKSVLNNTVLCDQPTLVNVIFAAHDLGNDPDVWERLGEIASTQVIKQSQTIYSASVPEGMYYAIIAHFADNSTEMSNARIK